MVSSSLFEEKGNHVSCATTMRFFACKGNSRLVRNASIESREGDVKSPNFPEAYSDDNHFQLHIKLPNASSSSERVVIHFKMVDLEFQEECLYDYVGLQSVERGPMKKICGRYSNDLETYVSNQFLG